MNAPTFLCTEIEKRTRDAFQPAATKCSQFLFVLSGGTDKQTTVKRVVVRCGEFQIWCGELRLLVHAPTKDPRIGGGRTSK